MFLIPEVFINFLVDSLIVIFGFFALLVSVQMVLYFDNSKDTPLQYKLLKRDYLVSTIVRFALFFKIPLLFYFIFTVDKLSDLIHGAMCGAGVITINSFGVYLLSLKVVNIYLFGLWLLVNKEDMQTKGYIWTKFKFKFFIMIFVLLFLEFVLEVLYFNGIDISKVVSCCGVLFNPVAKSSLGMFLKIPKDMVAGVFYFVFIMIVIFGWIKNTKFFSILSLVFLPLSILAIIVFF